MIRRPPRSTLDRSSAASDVYKRQVPDNVITSRVKTAVSNDPTLKATDINIETYKGVVHLSGFVNSPSVIHRAEAITHTVIGVKSCLLYTSPSPRDRTRSRMPSSA